MTSICFLFYDKNNYDSFYEYHFTTHKVKKFPHFLKIEDNGSSIEACLAKSFDKIYFLDKKLFPEELKAEIENKIVGFYTNK